MTSGINSKPATNICKLPSFAISRIMFALIFLLAIGNNIYSAPSIISAKTDTNNIRIGEQFHLNFFATISKGSSVTFPFLTDTFNHFEVVKKDVVDTLISKDSKELTLKQQLTLTSFDSGYFVIPPFTFVVKEGGKTDTVISEAILISVTTIPVDTTKSIRAIKNIIEVPFPWLDYLLIVIAAAIVITIVLYIIRRMNKNKFIIGPQAKPQLLPHEIALIRLKEIEEEKLWQQGYTKKYYSEVPDVLRQYLERRFEINAMEQTTDEILQQLRKVNIDDENKEKLSFILRLADMVKFAKGQPLPFENEKTLSNACDFINTTRPVIKTDFEKEEAVK